MEGINWVAIGGFVLLAIERVVYYISRYFRGNNPGTTDGVLKLLKAHEKADDARHRELKEALTKVQEKASENGERIAGLEALQQ